MALGQNGLTSEPGPSLNSVLLRWASSLNVRSKLKGQRKTIKFGFETSLVPSLALHSRFEQFSRDTVPLNS